MAIFVSGIGTGVGKSFFSKLLMAKYAVSQNIQYWKPVETGSIEESDFESVKNSVPISKEKFIEPVARYSFPASPHLSAKLESKTLDLEKWNQKWSENSNRRIIIEGAGGLLVPINDQILYLDYIKKYNLPVMIVTYTGLGSINHTLLSLEALKLRNVSCLGYFMMGKLDLIGKDNLETIQKFSGVPCIGTIEIPEKELAGEELVQYSEKFFDLDGKVLSALEKIELS